MPFGRYTCGGPVTHCVGRGDLGSNPQPKRAVANCSQTVSPMLPPGEYKRGVGWTCHRDSAFCHFYNCIIIIDYVENALFFCRNNFLKIQLFYGDISYNSLEQSPAYDVEALLSMHCDDLSRL